MVMAGRGWETAGTREEGVELVTICSNRVKCKIFILQIEARNFFVLSSVSGCPRHDLYRLRLPHDLPEEVRPQRCFPQHDVRCHQPSSEIY